MIVPYSLCRFDCSRITGNDFPDRIIKDKAVD